MSGPKLLLALILSIALATSGAVSTSQILAQQVEDLVRVENELFSDNILVVGSELTITGEVSSSDTRPNRAVLSLSIESNSIDASENWKIVTKNPPGSVIDIPAQQKVPYSFTISPLETGSYLIRTRVEISNLGTTFGKGETIMVNSNRSEDSLKNLDQISSGFAKTLNNIVQIPGFIGLASIESVRTVTNSTVQTTIDDLINENTIVLDTTDLVEKTSQNTTFIRAQGLVKINDIPNSEKMVSAYRTSLQTVQNWPSGKGLLIQPGDFVAKIHWNVKGQGELTSIAIMNPTAEIKFEPLMYSTPTTIFIGGSNHIFELKNFFGWTVVHVEVIVTGDSSDNCVISTPPDDIAHIDSWTAPLWNVSAIPKGQKLLEGNCQTDSTKQLECSKGESTVAYSAFFPNWKFGQTSSEVSKSDLPMATGQAYIWKMVCAPEFPVAPVLLGIGLVVLITAMKITPYGLRRYGKANENSK